MWLWRSERPRVLFFTFIVHDTGSELQLQCNSDRAHIHASPPSIINNQTGRLDPPIPTKYGCLVFQLSLTMWIYKVQSHLPGLLLINLTLTKWSVQLPPHHSRAPQSRLWCPDPALLWISIDDLGTLYKYFGSAKSLRHVIEVLFYSGNEHINI